MVIEVKNCKDCPFANHYNEFGGNRCNLSDKIRGEIEMWIWEKLPEDRRHENCPLTEQLTIVVDLSA